MEHSEQLFWLQLKPSPYIDTVSLLQHLKSKMEVFMGLECPLRSMEPCPWRSS